MLFVCVQHSLNLVFPRCLKLFALASYLSSKFLCFFKYLCNASAQSVNRTVCQSASQSICQLASHSFGHLAIQVLLGPSIRTQANLLVGSYLADHGPLWPTLQQFQFEEHSPNNFTKISLPAKDTQKW